jgi:hypothetical protein
MFGRYSIPCRHREQKTSNSQKPGNEMRMLSEIHGEFVNWIVFSGMNALIPVMVDVLGDVRLKIP